MSTQGEEVLAILLSNPTPRQQLNSFICEALRPAIASLGPWPNGYGTRQEVLDVTFRISQSTDGLQFQQLADSSGRVAPSVVIEDISKMEVENYQGMEDSRSAILSPNLQLVLVHEGNNDDLQVSELTLSASSDMLNDTNTVGLVHAHSSSASASEYPSHKKCKGKASAPIDNSNLHRSTRNNKYDGFKIHQPTDSRSFKSKVKNKEVPSALKSITPGSSAESEASEATIETQIPPPTPIPTMQAVGVQLCAILEDELTEEALAMEPGVAPSSSA